MGLCLDAECPLNEKRLLHDSCPGQFLDRVYTLAHNSYLTFVRPSDNGYYYQNYFQCQNERRVTYKQVCDLIDDCGDWSDETACANHLICSNTNKSNTKKQLISIEQRCDGIYDCFDLSDECNELCGKEILGHWVLKYLCWLMGLLAIFFNACSVARGMISVRYCSTENMLITKALIIVIGFGDFLIGVYLFVLSVYDSLIFGRRFCKEQARWLTGTVCAFLGVISTLGSQLSLFAMTVLSMKRVYGLFSEEMITASQLNKRAVIKAISSVFAVVAASSAVALIPLLPATQDSSVQGMLYDANYKVFIGFPNKERHLKILSEYYNSSSPEEISEDMTWQEIGQKVDGMFTQDYGNLTRTPVHFYGNDGVCLFKYFVRTDDARRSRQFGENTSDITQHKGDTIVWFMMGINLACFIFIAIAYAIIYRLSKESADSRDPPTQQENQALQTKVAVLIASDFLCWVPFIVVSGLHNLKIIDATSWYVNFAMTVLPLNSIINPLIYNCDYIGPVVRKIPFWGTKLAESRLAVFIHQKLKAEK